MQYDRTPIRPGESTLIRIAIFVDDQAPAIVRHSLALHLSGSSARVVPVTLVARTAARFPFHLLPGHVDFGRVAAGATVQKHLYAWGPESLVLALPREIRANPTSASLVNVSVSDVSGPMLKVPVVVQLDTSAVKPGTTVESHVLFSITIGETRTVLKLPVVARIGLPSAEGAAAPRERVDND